MMTQVKAAVIQKTLVMQHKQQSIAAFFFLVLLSLPVIAYEQNVAVHAEVSDSITSRIISWLYEDPVKEIIIGSIITLVTIAFSICVYYLARAW